VTAISMEIYIQGCPHPNTVYSSRNVCIML